MIGSSLLRYREGQRFLIHDFETEGLSLYHSRPWQLAYAICTLKEVEAIVVRHLDWPNLKVSDEAARITRFDLRVHKEIAEDPAKVIADFDDLIYDPQYLPAGHNTLGFDTYIHQTARRLCGKPKDWSYLPRMLDTNALSKAHQKGFKPEPDNMQAFQYKCLDWREKTLKSSLGFMARQFGVEYDERYAHDAAYDCRVNHGILNKLIWSLEI